MKITYPGDDYIVTIDSRVYFKPEYVFDLALKIIQLNEIIDELKSSQNSYCRTMNFRQEQRLYDVQND